MKFELQVMMGKLQIIGNPKFDEVIKATVIDLAEEEAGEGDKTPSIPQGTVQNEHVVELTEQKQKDGKTEESNERIEKNPKPSDSFKLPPI